MRDATPQKAATGDLIGIVDDDPFVADSLNELLRSHGFDTLLCRTGIALMADERRAALRGLVIDFNMPGLDGLDVIVALRREGIRIPSILITGRLDGRIAGLAAAFDLVATLEKPFSGAGLIEALRTAIGEAGSVADDPGPKTVSPKCGRERTRGSSGLVANEMR